MAEALATSRACNLCKAALVDATRAVISAVNAIRQAAWAQEAWADELERFADVLQVVKSKADSAGLPTTAQGQKAQETLATRLKDIQQKLQELQDHCSQAYMEQQKLVARSGERPHGLGLQAVTITLVVPFDDLSTHRGSDCTMLAIGEYHLTNSL